MAKFAGFTLLLVGAAGIGWWWWQESKRPLAEVWAAGTDRLS